MPGEFDPIEILRVLTAHRVEAVVIGGFAAWMQGAPVLTTDVDIVYRAGPDNIDALVLALTELDAVYRAQPERQLRPTHQGLASTQAAGHHLLTTRHGDLDVLRTVSDFGFEDLAKDTLTLEVDGTRFDLVRLERIIALKEMAGRPKDVAALPTLRATLAERDDSRD